MKRTILLMLCLALGSFSLAGCADGGETFVQKEYMSGVQPIEEISIDVRDRQIEVSISEDSRVHITYFESSKEAYGIAVSEENVLTMTSVTDKDWTDYIGVKPSEENRKILLQIPDALLKDLTLSTTNEDILLLALTATGGVNLSCNGGDITFEKLDVGEALTLSVKDGDISGTVAGGYDDFAIQTKVKKGESNLPGSKSGGEKTLNVSGNNGDVNIEFA